MRTFVIVGANLTGGAAATTLRSQGFEDRIVMIGAEAHPPYERPPLSKDYLRGETDLANAYLRPPEWYEENGVELLLNTRATRVDPAGRTVELEGGRTIPYDRVLLATGGRNRHLNVPGVDLDGVLSLRTVEDSDRIRGAAARGGTAVVVGAGFIGSEVTASLRQLGVEVEVVEFLELPLLRVVGPEVGRVLADIHRDHGVRFHFSQSVERFDGAGRVEAVVTNTGDRIACDFAVVGVGIEPVTDVVAGTDVAIDNGILVDDHCRTNVEDVFAAGDVANHDHPVFGRRMRVEHYDNALKQGAAVAKNMMGVATVFDDPHWFWSDQYDTNIQYAGFAPQWDELVVRGSMEERSFAAFYLHEGLVRAVVAVNRGKDVRRSMGLIRAARPVETASLADEDVDLRTLAAPVGKGS